MRVGLIFCQFQHRDSTDTEVVRHHDGAGGSASCVGEKEEERK